MRVTVIDYKAGNLTSVLKALHHLSAETVVTDSDLAPIERAERIVLPGVGHFAATQRLDDTGMTPAIRVAIARGVPFLGICVGMQWLLEGSEEAPEQPGLGYFMGKCKRFPDNADRDKVPHVGWNHILPRVQPSTRLLAGIQPENGGEYAYFTHSYYVPTRIFAKKDMRASGSVNTGSVNASITRYILTFASAVEHENVFGVQFHPEKSGEAGLKILRNFLEMPQ
jgi:imidazole glycerol-phosphate synthase subunit HisH